MSFGIDFQRLGCDGPIKMGINPLTRLPIEYRGAKPLSATEVDAVRAALQRAGAKSNGDDSYMNVRFADGCSAEISVRNLNESCGFSIRGIAISPSLAQLLFDVMIAGDWLLMDENFVVIAPTKARAETVPPEIGKAVVATSPEEVAALLSGPFGEWKQYLDQVTK